MMTKSTVALRITLLFIIIIIITTAAVAPSAHAAGTAAEATAHYKRGLKEYAAKNYEAAIAEFRAAYLYDPKREVLYAWAQSERLSGDCPSAMVLYRQFLDGAPAGEQADAARGNLDRCEQALSTRPVADEPERRPQKAAAKPAPRPVVRAAPTVMGAGTRPARPHRAFYKDLLGDGLVGAGVLGLAVGYGYWSSANDTQDEANAAMSYEEYGALADEAASARTTATVLLAGGAGLLIGGVVRWVFVGTSRESRGAPAVTMTAGAGGDLGLVVSGRF